MKDAVQLNDNGERFYLELEALLKFKQDDLFNMLKSQRNKSEIAAVLRDISFALCGIFFYSGYVIGHLKKADIYKADPYKASCYVGGNASKLLDWAAKGSYFDNKKAFSRLFSEFLIRGIMTYSTVTTINKWLPVLCLTDFQKTKFEAHKLNSLINNATTVNRGVDELIQNIEDANGTVVQLGSISQSLQKATEIWDKSAEKVAGMNSNLDKLNHNLEKNNTDFTISMVEQAQRFNQRLNENAERFYAQLGEVQDLLKEQLQHGNDEFNGQVKKQNEQFQTYVYNSLERTKELQETSKNSLLEQASTLKRNFELQNEQLHEVVKTLKLYDTNFASTNDALRQELTDSIQNNINSANQLRELIDMLSTHDEKYLEAVTKPVEQRLGILSEKITAKLDDASNNIGGVAPALASLQQSFKEPLKLIRDTYSMHVDGYDKINRRVEESLGEFQHNIGKIVNDNVVTLEGVKRDIKEALDNFGAENIKVDNSALKENFENIEVYMKAIRKQQEDNNYMIAQLLEQQGKGRYVRGQSLNDKLIKFVPIVMTVLLFLCLMVQGVMVSRIGTLESNQTQVNKMIMDEHNAKIALNIAKSQIKAKAKAVEDAKASVKKYEKDLVEAQVIVDSALNENLESTKDKLAKDKLAKAKENLEVAKKAQSKVDEELKNAELSLKQAEANYNKVFGISVEEERK